MFSNVERFNRESTFLAFYRAAKQKGLTDTDAFEVAKDGVNTSHFKYGKADRPKAGRGRFAPLLTFRLFLINYVQFLKNRLKQGEYATFAKSMGALTTFAGLTGLPAFQTINSIYNWQTGEDAEKQIREAVSDFTKGLLGKDATKQSQFAERLVTKGIPAALFGVDFSGSVGMGDIIPGVDIADIVGVIGDIPKRGARVARDINSGDFLRAFEDISPEFIRNPLAAIRLSTKGMITRGGSPIRDGKGNIVRLTPTQAAKKALGFQPIELTENFKVFQLIRDKEVRRKKLKSQYLDAFMVAVGKQNNDLLKEIQSELAEYNEDRNLEDRIIISGQDIVNRAMGQKPSIQVRPFKREVEKLFQE